MTGEPDVITGEPQQVSRETRAGLPEVIHLPDLSPPPPAKKARQPRSSAVIGRHFGPRRVDDPRTAWLTTRCTPAFRAAVIAAAEKAGLSLADYVHTRLGGSPGPRARRNPGAEAVLLARLLGQHGKAGSNLNQIARRLNSDEVAQLPELAAAIAEHRAVCEAIMRALGA